MTIQVKQRIEFTQQQLKFINEAYPEVVGGGQSDAELRYRAGQRSVVLFLATRVQKQVGD